MKKSEVACVGRDTKPSASRKKESLPAQQKRNELALSPFNHNKINAAAVEVMRSFLFDHTVAVGSVSVASRFAPRFGSDVHSGT